MKKLLFLSVVVFSLMRTNAQVNYIYAGQISNLEFNRTRLARINPSYVPEVSYTRNNWRFIDLFPDTLAARYREDVNNPGNLTKYPTYASAGFTFDPYSWSFYPVQYNPPGGFGLLEDYISGVGWVSYSYRLDTLSMWADYRLPNGYNSSSPDTLRVYLAYLDYYASCMTINLTWNSGAAANQILVPNVSYPNPIPHKGTGPIMTDTRRVVDYILTDKDSLLRPSAAASNSHKEIRIPIPHGFAVPPGVQMAVVVQYLPGYNYNLGDFLDVKYYNSSTFVNQVIHNNMFSLSSWDYSGTLNSILFLNDSTGWGYNTFYVEDKAVRYQNGVTPNEQAIVNWSLYNFVPDNPSITSGSNPYPRPAFWMSLSVGDDINVASYNPCDYDIKYMQYYASVCPGGTYSDANFSNLNTSGEYHRTLTGTNGCDSVVCLMLTIAPVPITHYWASFCLGGSYTDNNFTTPILSPGTYYDTLQSISGCGDSIVCLALSYYPSIPVTYYSGVICYGKTYSDNNFQNLSVPNTYYNTLQSVHGCDSVVCLTLTSYPQIAVSNYSAYLCYGKTYSDNNFTNLASPNIYYDTLKTKNGCDSVVCLTLTAYPKIDTTRYPRTICQGKTYSDANFSNITTAGKHYKTLYNAHNCDSVIELTLTVNPTSLYTYYETICQGGSFSDKHFSNKTQTGLYYDTLVNAYGCDSLVCLNLTVNPVSLYSYARSICQGKTFSDNNFTNKTQTGVYDDTLKNIYNCDSIVRLTLTVLPNVALTKRSAILCYGKTYSDNDFKNLSVPNIYYDTLPNINGCDSIIELTLTAYPQIPLTKRSAILCYGKTYSDNDFKNINAAGTYYDTLKNFVGCDSIIELTLTAYPQIPVTTYPRAICQGSSYSDDNFSNKTQTGFYYDTLHNAYGCDSVVCLNLTVNLPSSSSYSRTICQNDSYSDANFPNVTAAGTYQKIWKNIHGCDSTVSLTLTVNAVSIIPYAKAICHGETYSDERFTDKTQSGSYDDTLKTVNGCDSIIRLTLTVNPLPEKPVISRGQNNMLISTMARSYQWYYFYEPIQGATVRNYTYDKEGQYAVETANEYGCKVKSDSIVTDVGIVDIDGVAGLRVYPNPAKNELLVTGYDIQENDVYIQIYSVVGQILIQRKLQSETTVVNVESLATGLYYLKIDNKVVRFVKE